MLGSLDLQPRACPIRRACIEVTVSLSFLPLILPPSSTRLTPFPTELFILQLDNSPDFPSMIFVWELFREKGLGESSLPLRARAWSLPGTVSPIHSMQLNRGRPSIGGEAEDKAPEGYDLLGRLLLQDTVSCRRPKVLCYEDVVFWINQRALGMSINLIHYKGTNKQQSRAVSQQPLREDMV